ncbi:NUDIX domain-containing protein [Streptomyces violaceusniger]|uniref:NUDIX hydrolase n=1 Tax=Streptomyces violaceusniger (strain Tu 4113) TaxID=653045 RepID=G2PI27_STRV4|nr:NUDIX domain-containing protein [Streptomyces violaceusniger]AEM88978.1 NUDIX hydrolase [Streptomyces violaceusniger Tu 4113]
MIISATRIRTSAKAVIIHEGAVLLTRNLWRGQERHFLPGGGQNPGEPLPETVRREVLEETGVTVAAGHVLGTYEWTSRPEDFPDETERVHQVEIIFRCTLTGRPDLGGGHEHDHDQIGAEWVPLDMIPILGTLMPAYRGLFAGMSGDRFPGSVYLGYDA